LFALWGFANDITNSLVKAFKDVFVISHLKLQYRLMRCFLKGFVGDQIKLMLAAGRGT